MPVEISLERLVSVAGAAGLWPDAFAGLVGAVEQNPDDQTAWFALADWCQDVGEGGLSRAARWAGKRKGAGAKNARRSLSSDAYWKFEELPAAVSAVFPQAADRRTIAGLLADLAAALRRLDEEIGTG